MSTKYLCKSIEVTNYRAFRKLIIPSLKRINIIGGFNGVGKSTLLETIFLSLDTNNSAALTKPYAWRQIPVTSSSDLSYLFRDRENDARVRMEMSIGDMDIIISQTKVPQNVISMLSSSIQKSIPDITSAPAIDENGIKTSVSLNRSERIRSFSLFTMNGIGGVAEKMESIQIPTSIMLGSSVKSSAEENAQRLSDIIRSRRQESVLTPLRLIQPDLESFSILHNQLGPSIYATLKGELVPVNFLGDGFLTLFNVILAISHSKDGVVLLDEVDTSLHYSVTSAAWKIISQAADAENCQLFATSHSRESIINAAEGIESAGREKDFQYIRLEKKDNDHKAITYSMKDLRAAEEFNFEFR